MATWLAYLKSKLLLPQDDEDDFKATEIAEKLKLQLKKQKEVYLWLNQTNKRFIQNNLRNVKVAEFFHNQDGSIKTVNTIIN